MEKVYDVAILGGGPAGMTAGIYAKRAGLDVVIVEKSVAGGAVATTFEVANYTGFSKIAGMELSMKMFEHVSSLDVPFVWDEVKTVHINGDIKVIECYQTSIKAKTVILGFGASVRKLNLSNERKFLGRGVSYCATCDGNFFKDKVVALVGGGNTALEDCLYLSNLAKKVYLIHRRDEFRGQDILANEVRAKENISLVLNSNVTAISGDTKLQNIEVTNKITLEKTNLDVDGLFVCIGRGPDTEMINGDLELNSNGYIKTNEYMQTNVEGVYAVGDIRETPLRQILTACADGAIAATKAFEYIRTNKKV